MPGSFVIACPHCTKALQVSLAIQEQCVTCFYCGGSILLPASQDVEVSQASAQDNAVESKFPEGVSIEKPESLGSGFGFDSQSSISVHLEGMFNGRYLINRKPVLVRTRGADIEVTSNSVQVVMMIGLAVSVIVLVIALAIGATAMIGVGSKGSRMTDHAPEMMLLQIAGPVVFIALASGMVYLATKVGKKVVIRLSPSAITSVRKGVGAVGTYVLRLDFRGGRLLMAVPNERAAQLRKFVATATGRNVK